MVEKDGGKWYERIGDKGMKNKGKWCKRTGENGMKGQGKRAQDLEQVLID